MPSKKNTSTTKKSKIKIDNTESINTSTKNLSRKDRMHEKVENYVYRNRDKTSQKIIENKSKRHAENYTEADLETMISKIELESNPNSIKKDNKGIIYLIYIIIIIAFLLIIMKGFIGNVPQIG